MSNTAKQSTLFKGIYEFEDPSGTLLAAKVPAAGTVDLYSGTAVVVKPTQCAIFIYKGQVTDLLFSGTHEIKTQNVPILTRLANWKFGFESPLRCELIFVAGHEFTSRRWGSPQPVLVDFAGVGTIPVRAFGNFNLSVKDPAKFFTKLFGTRTAYSITDLEEFVQGQIVESLPEAFSSIKEITDLSKSLDLVSRRLEKSINAELAEFGVAAHRIQVLSALPSKEVIEAIDAKAAISVIGSQKEYLLYKAANSLSAGKDGTANDPMQMMMGLMLGKGLLGSDDGQKFERTAIEAKAFCDQCGAKRDHDAKFCAQCGKKV